MSAVPASETSWPLSPEQRAVLAMQGTQAIQLLRLELPGRIDRVRLRAVVASALRPHQALRVSIRQVPGYRGLRLLPGDDAWSPEWQDIECSSGLQIAQGELVRVALVRSGQAQHTLVLAVSALAADRASLATLASEIASAYQQDQARAVADLFQYPQYAEWREDLAQGEEAEAGHNYWSGYLQLAAAPAPPRLSYRQRGTPLPGAQRLRATRVVDAALARRVSALAAGTGTDAEVLLQAVWWLLLARLTGFDRFAGGWQHDCRRDYEVMQGAVGVFEKVLPLAIDVAGDESFRQWLERLASVASAHVQAQEDWAIDAPASATHLAVGFVFHDAPTLPDGWRIAELPGPLPCFELAMQVDWSEQAVALAVQADASLYSRQAVERLQEQYLTLLDAVLGRADSPVSQLAWIGPDERSALQALRGPVADFGPQTLAVHVARWASETPDAPAIEAGEQRLSYRELDARANRMAHWLQAQGVGAGALVALELPRSADLLVGMLAAWRAGAGYLPLEPDWPEARREAVLADAQPVLVLRAVPDCIELARFAPTPPTHAGSLDDAAYVLYTSGSTGRPKGVVIEQGQLLNYVTAASAAMDLGTCRRWALSSSVAADLGNTALFCAWFNGACVVVADRHEAEDADAFAHFMAERRIDALKMVPSHLDALLECAAPRLPRTLVLGGEAAPGALIERIARLAPECAIYNHYGPTETTVGVMVHRVNQDGAVPEVLPLTQVLANNRVHVLDAAMQAVPAGALGELYIGGTQLCRGYLNREGEGAFVPDPFEPGARLYRTGDLAHVLPEGGFRLAGRADHQLKIRGFRVEPAEVEAALLAQPGVSQAVVLALADAAGTTQLSAFLVGNIELASEQGQRQLRERLAALLPPHMLPACYAHVAAFPRLVNGKIDRLALQALAARRDDKGQAADTAASDPVEAAIAQCMATLFKRPGLVSSDDFFELGGHSLLAIKLAARLRKLFQVELAPGAVFDHRSAAALAAFLRQDRAAAPSLMAKARQALAAAGEATGADQVPTVPDPEGIHVMHRDGGRVPLFCFSGLFASALEYRAILDALPPDRPVHRFVCHTLTRARWRGWRLEELAAGYCSYIVGTAGKGPVALLGWSVGGDLAFEVARQLQDRGLDLRFLGLLDVMHPLATRLTAQTNGAAADDLGAVEAWIAGSSMRSRWQELFSRLDAQEKLLATMFLRDHVIASPADGEGTDAVEYRTWARLNHGAMMRRYEWRPGRIPAHVWHAESSVMNPGQQLRDWRALAQVRSESVVAGRDHRSLLDDAGLARELAAQLLAID